jgi:hypothetical protein
VERVGACNATVVEVMPSPVVTVSLDPTLVPVWQRMWAARCDHVVVVTAAGKFGARQGGLRSDVERDVGEEPPNLASTRCQHAGHHSTTMQRSSTTPANHEYGHRDVHRV